MLALPEFDPITRYAVRLGDDALVLGHRLSEWCSRAPFLEEELALANVALDYIGRARLYYGYAAERLGDGTSEDDLAYLRDCRAFTNLLIYELPRGDFAFTMARQFLIDAFQVLFLERLARSTDATLSGIAGKGLKESRYHLRRSHDWMLRLGDGTEESHRRLQRAVDELWGYTPELFECDRLEAGLAESGIAIDCATLEPRWRATVDATFTPARVTAPRSDWRASGGRDGNHTEFLGHLLAELQFLQRAYPGLEW